MGQRRKSRARRRHGSGYSLFSRLKDLAGWVVRFVLAATWIWVALKVLVNSTVHFEPMLGAAIMLGALLCLVVLLSPTRPGERQSRKEPPPPRRAPRIKADRRGMVWPPPEPEPEDAAGDGGADGAGLSPPRSRRRGRGRIIASKRRSLTRVNPAVGDVG